jgi:hypothetical protein
VLKLPILHSVLVRSCSDGKKWVYPNAILYVFVIMTIRTTTVSCIHFTHFLLFSSLQLKWRLILCVTCFSPIEFVSVRQMFTSCQRMSNTFFNFREVWCMQKTITLNSILIKLLHFFNLEYKDYDFMQTGTHS